MEMLRDGKILAIAVHDCNKPSILFYNTAILSSNIVKNERLKKVNHLFIVSMPFSIEDIKWNSDPTNSSSLAVLYDGKVAIYNVSINEVIKVGETITGSKVSAMNWYEKDTVVIGTVDGKLSLYSPTIYKEMNYPTLSNADPAIRRIVYLELDSFALWYYTSTSDYLIVVWNMSSGNVTKIRIADEKDEEIQEEEEEEEEEDSIVFPLHLVSYTPWSALICSNHIIAKSPSSDTFQAINARMDFSGSAPLGLVIDLTATKPTPSGKPPGPRILFLNSNGYLGMFYFEAARDRYSNFAEKGHDPVHSTIPNGQKALSPFRCILIYIPTICVMFIHIFGENVN